MLWDVAPERDGLRAHEEERHADERMDPGEATRDSDARGFVELEPAPVVAGREETIHNPRARSAKLRVLARQEAA